VDARQLGYFLAIVDHGGFGRAAERLHIAQPSLSQAMAGLERELGVKLFVRAGRGVTLTDAGSQLVGAARRVLRDLDDAKAIVRSAGELRRGRVDLVSMPSPGIEPLTTIMTAFARSWPAMSVNVVGVFTPEEVVETVVSGVAEIGFLGSSGTPHTADLTVRHIEDQPLVLISPPGSALPAGDCVERADLTALRLVGSHRGSLMRQLVDDILASGAEAQLAAEVDHRTSILPLVLSGVGHAVMPASWTFIATRLGVEVRRIEPVSVLSVSAVWRGPSLSPGAAAFLEVLDEHIATNTSPHNS